MKKMIILDGNSIMFRAYYATAYTGNLMQARSGLYTNAYVSSENYPNRLWLYNNAEVAIYGSEIQLRSNTTINGNLVVSGDIAAA